MGLNYKTILGTAGADQQTAICGYVMYGFAGDDVLVGTTGENQLMIGGSGNDTYRPINNNLMTIMDRDGGSDTLDAKYLDFNDPKMWWATVESKHLFLVIGGVSQGVLILDAFTSASQIETFNLKSGTYSMADIMALTKVPYAPGKAYYYGDLTMEKANVIPGGYTKADAVAGWADFAAKYPNGQVPDFAGPDHVKIIAMLYEAGFGRAADAGGLNYWIDQYDAGLSLQQMAAGFLDSQEFTARYGDDDAMNATRFVEVMYNNVLGRAPDTGGYDYWVTRMDGGMDREQTLQQFALSDENCAGGNLPMLREVSASFWDFV
ncbi:MAG: DUF4214 domain-containing protein [Beijerinckiaceae bacterium]